MKFCILKNEDPKSHIEWEKACVKMKCDYSIVDLTSLRWFDEATSDNYDCYLLKPPGRTLVFKKMYDERVFVLSKLLDKITYPSYEEILIHENKKMLSYWLKSVKLPFIKTKVFYDSKETMDFLHSTKYPIVVKTSLGGSGSGVKFLKDIETAKKYTKEAFTSGIRRSTGPGLRQGSYFKRALNWLVHPEIAVEKIRGYITDMEEYQKGFILVQEYIPHDFEWRGVKIGNSYFAHKKMKVGEMCSGSKGITYVNPPQKLFDFIKYVCEIGNFNGMSIDMLEDENGNYLINELQTIFGHIQDHILEVDGKAGRYIFQNNKWVFEEGNFNSNLSFDLRLQNVLELLNKK